jgi:hypothetical protein
MHTLKLAGRVRRLRVVQRGVDDVLRSGFDAGRDRGFRLNGFVLTRLVVVHTIGEIPGPDCQYHQSDAETTQVDTNSLC